MIRCRHLKKIIFLILLPATLNAADVSYSAGVLLSQYSNVRRIPNPTEKETSYTLVAAMTAVDDTADFSMYIDGNIRSINYTKDLVADRTTGDLVANLVWKILPGQFDWILDDTFTETSIIQLANNSPSNRQNVNIISTGPNYTVRFNATSNLLFTSRVETYRYESRLANRDNNRATLTAQWARNMNSRLTLSLNDLAEKVDYENSLISSYARNDVFLGVNYSSGLHTLDAQYGFTVVNYDDRENTDFDRYLLAISRQTSRNALMSISFQEIATDAGQQLVQTTPGNVATNTQTTIAAADLFVDKTLRAQYSVASTSSGFNLDFYTREREYQRQTFLNNDSKAAILIGNWNFLRGDTITYTASYINTLYFNQSIDREDDDIIYSIQYNRRLRRNLNLGLSVIDSERDSTDGRFSYEDLTVIININYSSL